MFAETKFFHKAGEGSGGGGGSDPHNLGYYADLTALQTAYPTGTDGDFAILGSTDTIWVWDSGTSAWKDTDTKGQVTSVNNQTGAVTLTASDVGAATSAQGAKADTAVQPGDLATVATTGAYSDLTGTPTIPAAQVNSDWNASSGVAEILNKPMIPAAIQVSTMPTAGADELGKVYQFIGTTDANYTHGYFYECKAQGTNPETYAWEAVEVQAGGGGGGQNIQVSTLPTASATEVDNIYQFIGTTDANYTNGCFYKCVVLPNSTYTWQIVYPVDLLQYKGDYYKTLGVGKNVTMIKNGRYISEYALAVGDNSSVAQNYAVAIGVYSAAGGDNSIAVGDWARTSGSGSIQIGTTNSTNTGASSVAIGNYTFTNSSSSVVVGNLATANNAVLGVAIGANAKVQARNAIQLGAGTNSEAGTLYIGSYYNNAGVNYKLLDADGTIPAARHATLPAADGTYTLQVVITDGVPTLSWVAV